MFNRLSKSLALAEPIDMGKQLAPKGRSIDLATLTSMLDAMPINVMMADPKDLTITYINQTSVDTLKTVRELLPKGVDPEKMLGVCIDIFHKNPSHQRNLLADPRNLPHIAHHFLPEHL